MMSTYAAHFAESTAGQTLTAVSTFFDLQSTQDELARELARIERSARHEDH